jgi:hypothetical protein
VWRALAIGLNLGEEPGIELIHPMREGRSPQQIGRKGLSKSL